MSKHCKRPVVRAASAATAAARCAVETLETRRLFVGFTVDGTEGADSISLGIDGNSILFVVNGVSDTRSDILFNEVTIDAKGGNDTISIIETGNNTVTVNGGLGNDTINFTPGANDLDAIDDSVTVNGDGGTDTTVLHDQAETTDVSYFFGGNTVDRSNMPEATVNTESVVVHGGSAGNTFVLQDPPTPVLTLNGNGNTGTIDSVIVTGAAGTAASYTPSPTTNGSGTVVFQGRTANFNTVESVICNQVPTVTFVAPNASDTLSLGSTNILSGSSSGVSFAPLEPQECGTLTLDVATNDGGAGNDTISLSGTMNDVTQVNVNAGTGNNTLTVSGTYTVDTDLGATSGTNLTVLANGAAANPTFAGFQNLKRLEINNSATVRFNGTGTILNTRELAVVNGTGVINITSGQTAVCTLNGSFSIGAGRTLEKVGGGALNINAQQSHGAGAFFNAANGITNFATNAGSAASRPLSIDATGATINLNATQHLNLVSTGIGGLINVGTSGNRVLVCGGAFVSSEGSAINLNDNDMILDYTGATQIEDMRLLLRGGFANGAWIGIGITSGTAAAGPLAGRTGLGYAEATDLFTTFPATFAGQPVDDTAVLVKFTFYGDANLDGQTNLGDFNVLAANFGQGARRWVRGDNDYNLTINLADFNRLAAGFGGSGLAPDLVAGGGASRDTVASAVLRDERDELA